MPPDYSGIFNQFGQQGQQPGYYPSIDPTQQGEMGGYTNPSYGGLASLNNPNPTSAGSGGGSNWFGRDGQLSTLFGGIQALGGAYMGFQQLKLAKDNLNFQKKAYNTNLANSTATYNTSLADRINGRTSDYAGKQADVQAYLAAHSLKTAGG